ncbi:hypothetical protein OHB13_11950 [Streptomyces sp. NBC_00440]|uniref:hypothetical protein n=1 Tax=Streptomyces sp. NBC_00440 TaxID=2975741 RepID=UPI002E1D4105
MKHTHMAVGSVPEGLANVTVVVEFTPGEQRFGIKIYKGDEVLDGQVWNTWSSEPFDIAPRPHAIEERVFWALSHSHDFTARFIRGLAGAGHFEWDSPACMSRADRARFEADA